MILLETFAQVLVDLELGSSLAGSSDWSVFLAVEPKAPAACITLFEGQGRVRSVNTSDTGMLVEHREATINCRVRHPDYETAFNKSTEIEYALNRTGPWQVDGSLQLNDVILSFPTSSIGRDVKNLHIMLTTWRVLMTRYATPES